MPEWVISHAKEWNISKIQKMIYRSDSALLQSVRIHCTRQVLRPRTAIPWRTRSDGAKGRSGRGQRRSWTLPWRNDHPSSWRRCGGLKILFVHKGYSSILIRMSTNTSQNLSSLQEFHTFRNLPVLSIGFPLITPSKFPEILTGSPLTMQVCPFPAQPSLHRQQWPVL